MKTKAEYLSHRENLKSKEKAGNPDCGHAFQVVERLLDGFFWQICRSCKRTLLVR